MNVNLIKVTDIEVTDNDTNETTVLTIAGDFVPDFPYSTVEKLNERAIECPVVQGKVIIPDNVRVWNDEMGWFELA